MAGVAQEKERAPCVWREGTRDMEKKTKRTYPPSGRDIGRKKEVSVRERRPFKERAASNELQKKNCPGSSVMGSGGEGRELEEGGGHRHLFRRRNIISEELNFPMETGKKRVITLPKGRRRKTLEKTSLPCGRS